MVRKKTNLRNTIYKEIREDILTARLKEGEKLRESELAARFKVSRTPVREAIVQLQIDGFVSHIKDIGAVVKKISIQEVLDILDILCALETFAVEIVTRKKLNKSELCDLKKQIKEMERLIKRKDYKEYLKMNIKFHKFFTERCNNVLLNDLIINLGRRANRIINLGISIPRDAGRYLDLHRKLFEAVEAGDVERARALMFEHTQDRKNLTITEVGLREIIFGSEKSISNL